MLGLRGEAPGTEPPCLLEQGSEVQNHQPRSAWPLHSDHVTFSLRRIAAADRRAWRDCACRLQSREIVSSPSLMPTYQVPGPLLYVANAGLTLAPLTIYPADSRNPKPIATISKGIDNSRGTCIDSDGTLYVTNFASGTGWVSEYALGQTKALQ